MPPKRHRLPSSGAASAAGPSENTAPFPHHKTKKIKFGTKPHHGSSFGKPSHKHAGKPHFRPGQAPSAGFHGPTPSRPGTVLPEAVLKAIDAHFKTALPPALHPWQAFTRMICDTLTRALAYAIANGKPDPQADTCKELITLFVDRILTTDQCLFAPDAPNIVPRHMLMVGKEYREIRREAIRKNFHIDHARALEWSLATIERILLQMPLPGGVPTDVTSLDKAYQIRCELFSPLTTVVDIVVQLFKTDWERIRMSHFNSIINEWLAADFETRAFIVSPFLEKCKEYFLDLLHVAQLRMFASKAHVNPLALILRGQSATEMHPAYLVFSKCIEYTGEKDMDTVVKTARKIVFSYIQMARACSYKFITKRPASARYAIAYLCHVLLHHPNVIKAILPYFFETWTSWEAKQMRLWERKVSFNIIHHNNEMMALPLMPFCHYLLSLPHHARIALHRLDMLYEVILHPQTHAVPGFTETLIRDITNALHRNVYRPMEKDFFHPDVYDKFLDNPQSLPLPGLCNAPDEVFTMVTAIIRTVGAVAGEEHIVSFFAKLLLLPNALDNHVSLKAAPLQSREGSAEPIEVEVSPMAPLEERIRTYNDWLWRLRTMLATWYPENFGEKVIRLAFQTSSSAQETQQLVDRLAYIVERDGKSSKAEISKKLAWSHALAENADMLLAPLTSGSLPLMSVTLRLLPHLDIASFDHVSILKYADVLATLWMRLGSEQEDLSSVTTTLLQQLLAGPSIAPFLFDQMLRQDSIEGGFLSPDHTLEDDASLQSHPLTKGEKKQVSLIALNEARNVGDVFGQGQATPYLKVDTKRAAKELLLKRQRDRHRALDEIWQSSLFLRQFDVLKPQLRSADPVKDIWRSRAREWRQLFINVDSGNVAAFHATLYRLLVGTTAPTPLAQLQCLPELKILPEREQFIMSQMKRLPALWYILDLHHDRETFNTLQPVFASMLIGLMAFWYTKNSAPITSSPWHLDATLRLCYLLGPGCGAFPRSSPLFQLYLLIPYLPRQAISHCLHAAYQHLTASADATQLAESLASQVRQLALSHVQPISLVASLFATAPS